MSKQRTSGRLERRAEREARNLGSNGPRSRRQRPVATRKVDSGPKFLPPFLRNVSGATIAIVLGGIFLVVALGYAISQTGQTAGEPDWIKAENNSDPDLPGVYYPPHPGPDGELGTTDDRQHYATGTVIPICTAEQLANNQVSNPLCYTSNPPTSGPHADQPMPFRVLENPAPKENLIHNMEHGGVVIWYNTTNQDVIDKLKDITNEALDRRRLVVMSAYPGMEPETIAVTGWTRLEKFPVSDFTEKRVEDFISEHVRRFNPEGL